MTAEHPTPGSRAADAIRELLNDNGWTQGRLAEELGVTQPTISRWLSGKQDPNHEQTLRIYNLAFRATGEDIPENISDSISIMGHIGPDLFVKIASNENMFKAKLKYGMRAANLTGFVILSDTQTPLGPRGWIVLCSPGYSLPINQGGFYLLVLPDERPLFREVYFGPGDGTLHLIAPGLDPMLNVTAAPSMTVVGTIAPSAIEEPEKIDMG